MKNTRIIYKDNTVFSDLSEPLGNYLSGTQALAWVASEDALYIGSDLPFNHRWFEVSSINSVASSLTIKLWNGSSFAAAVDIIDRTSSAGKPFYDSGIISWSPNRYVDTWQFEDSTERISELSTLRIYDKYWAKIEVNTNLTSTFALKYVGYKFCNEEDLVSEYPDLNSIDFKTAYKDGKINWNDQIFSASEYIVQDLKAMNVIFSENQILQSDTFKKACVHKTAEIVYRGMGDDYKDNLAEANKAYKMSMNVKIFNVDRDANARLDQIEKTNFVGHMTR